jgi:hypothetical protein
MKTPYVCLVCGKAHSSMSGVKHCDHKKEVVQESKPKTRRKKKTEED